MRHHAAQGCGQHGSAPQVLHVVEDVVGGRVRASRRRSGRRRGRAPGRRSSAAVGSWVTMTTVWPRSSTARAEERRAARRRTRESRAPVGSSAKTMSGREASARAAATRCCWPPESSRRPVRRAGRSSPTVSTIEATQCGVRLAPGDPHRQHDVLGRGHRREQVERLEDEADPVAAQQRERLVAQRGDLGVAEVHLARGRPVEAGEHVQQRRLAGAGRPHDRGEAGPRSRPTLTSSSATTAASPAAVELADGPRPAAAPVVGVDAEAGGGAGDGVEVMSVLLGRAGPGSGARSPAHATAAPSVPIGLGARRAALAAGTGGVAVRPAPPPGFGQAPRTARRSERAHCGHDLAAGTPAAARREVRGRRPWCSPGSRRSSCSSTSSSCSAAARSSAGPLPRRCPCRCSRPPSSRWPSTRSRRGWSALAARARARRPAARRTTCCAGSPRRSPAATRPRSCPPRMARVLAEGTGAAWAQVWLVVGGRPTLAATWPPERRTASTTDRRPTRGARATLAARCGTAASCSACSVVQERPSHAADPGRGAALRRARRPGRAGAARRPAARRARAAAGRAVRAGRGAARLAAAAGRRRRTSERRLLERDIHDGAQQHLVALAVNLRLARDAGPAVARPGRASCWPSRSRPPREAIDTLVQLVPRHLPAAARRARAWRPRSGAAAATEPDPGRGRRAGGVGRYAAQRRGGGVLLLPRGAAERRQALRRDHDPGRPARGPDGAERHRRGRRRAASTRGRDARRRRAGEHARPGRVASAARSRVEPVPGGGTRVRAVLPAPPPPTPARGA